MGRWTIRPPLLCGGILLASFALTLSGFSADLPKPERTAAESNAPIASVPALTPLDLVQSSLARSRAILRAPATPAADPDERRRELRRVARELFAFDAMARRALGPQWSTLSDPNQQEFLRLFTDMIERVYGMAVERYARDQVTFLGEKVTGPHAEVRSRLMARGGTITVDYRMIEQQSRWAVHDAVIDDISIVANYRSQFDSIIRTSSFAQLLDRMQRFSRAPEFRPGDGTGPDDPKGLILAYLFYSAGTRK